MIIDDWWLKYTELQSQNPKKSLSGSYRGISGVFISLSKIP